MKYAMNEHSSSRCYAVGILGATGIVGQRFVSLLAHHPWFHITRLGASLQWEGVHYGKTRQWHLDTALPEKISNLKVVPCSPAYFKGHCDFVFSALSSDVAMEIESEFAEAGFPVFSNAQSHRRDKFVPILSPYVNPDHLTLVYDQPMYRRSGGFIVTNPNCAVAGLSLLLAPLYHRFPDLREISVTTLQAVSGAGYPGIPCMDIVCNVIPFIKGEEEKLEYEPRKMLGILQCINGDSMELKEAPFIISAACHRVHVLDGHTLTVSFNSKEKNLNHFRDTLTSFQPTQEVSNLPSCPKYPIVYEPSEDRPQPRRDLHKGKGMSIVVGPLRPCKLHSAKLTCVVHNTILGAAGGAILNGELAAVRGLIPQNVFAHLSK